jgi:hypothetical protein
VGEHDVAAGTRLVVPDRRAVNDDMFPAGARRQRGLRPLERTDDGESADDDPDEEDEPPRELLQAAIVPKGCRVYL